MPRSLRLEYEGAFYHVMARGNRRQAIFREDEDRRFFLRGLGEACGRTGWRVHAWVLMDNHYHLFIETPEANLVVGMKWLQNAYTRRFNSRHREWGRLFGDRYKSIPTDGRAGEYYAALADYIHLNPVRAGMVKKSRGEDLLDYPWSSLTTGYAAPPGKRAPWLAAASGLEALGCPDTAAGRLRYVARLETRATEETPRRCGVPPDPQDARKSHLRRGWYWGAQSFAEKLQTLLDAKVTPGGNRTYQAAPQHRAHGLAQAEAEFREGLRRQSLKAEELEGLAGNDPRKTELARRLWETTIASQAWIAERLHMKSAANVSQILRRTSNQGAALSRYVD